MRSVKNNAIFLGAYILICLICWLINAVLAPPIESIHNTKLAFVLIVIITLIVLISCFICGKFLGVNNSNTILNMLSSLTILVVVAVSVFLTVISKESMLRTVTQFFMGPVFLITASVSNTINISQQTCIVLFIFLPSIAFTFGAAMK